MHIIMTQNFIWIDNVIKYIYFTLQAIFNLRNSNAFSALDITTSVWNVNGHDNNYVAKEKN